MTLGIRKVIGSHSENSQAIFNILATGIIGGINFITLPIFTNLLGTEGFGEVSLYLAWVQILTLFVGLQASGTFSSASVAFSLEEQASYQKSILCLSLVSFCLIGGLCLVFMDPMGGLLGLSVPLYLCMMAQSVGASCMSIFTNRYIFSKHAQKNFCISVLLCVATTVGSIALILLPLGFDPVVGRALGLAIPNVAIAAFLSVPLLLSGAEKLDVKYWKFCLPLCIPLVFHCLGHVVLGQTDKVMLQGYGYGYAVVGVYSLGVTVAQIVSVIYSSLNSSFVPFMYDDLKSNDVSSLGLRCKRYIKFFTAGTIAFLLLGQDIVSLLSGPEYAQAMEVVPLLVVGCYFVFCYSFPVNFEFYLRKTTSIAFGTGVAAILNIGLNVLLIPQFGMVGAASSTVVAYGFLFAFHSVIANRMGARQRMPYKMLLIGLFLVIGFAVFVMTPLADGVIRLCLAAVALAFMLYCLLKEKALF